MQKKFIIFLDFDGVMRRLDDPKERLNPEFVECLEVLLRRYTKVYIVISSTWRLGMSMKKIKGFFSEDIHERIIGGTPETFDISGPYRYREIKQWVDEHKPRHWLALDDTLDLFPKNCPQLVSTDENKGLDEDALQRLESAMVSKAIGE